MANLNKEQLVDLLRHYKVQNPVKFVQKYGNVTPEEAVEKLHSTPRFNKVLGVSVELKAKEVKPVEQEFVDAPQEEKVKRTRKVKDVQS